MRFFFPRWLCIAALLCTITGAVQAAVIFRDDFNGSSLDPAWTITNPDPAAHSLGGGLLTLSTSNGSLNSSNYSNLFTIANPVADSDFVLTMHYVNFSPVADFQRLNLLVYNSDTSYVSLLYGYSYGTPRLEAYGTENNVLIPGGSSKRIDDRPPLVDFYLRLVRTGTTYTTGLSYDNITYYTEELGSPMLFTASPLRLGFLANQANEPGNPVPVQAQVDWFELQSNAVDNPTPEPASLAMCGGALALMAFLYRRR